MNKISYNILGERRSYTPVPLASLDSIRLRLRADLKELQVRTGEEFILRTFYLGPREKRNHNTLKTAARWAKIGVYKLQKRGKVVYPDGYVRRYVNSDLQYYV